MSEYNTKITYYKNGELDRRRTAIAHSKFYARMMSDNLIIRINHAKVSSRPIQPTE